MQRVALINWKNKNQDYDLSKIFSSIATSWVAEWLEVQNGIVTPWFAFINIVRDWITFPVLFQNTSSLNIDTTWTKKVFIEINQSNIDDWTTNSSDWTWIWSIKIASSYPTKNFIALASITSWVISDERNFIKIKPLSFDLIKLEKNWNYPQWCKLWRLKVADWSRFKIDLICWIGYGWYGWSNGWSLVRIIWSSAGWSFTCQWNWTENNGSSWISEIQIVEINDQEFDLYAYFTSWANPYWELLMKFDGWNNTKFTKNFSVSTPTWGVVFPKITPWTDIVWLVEKTNIHIDDFIIVSDSQNGWINKKQKIRTLNATTLQNQYGESDGYVSSIQNKKIFIPDNKIWTLNSSKSTTSTNPIKLKEFWIYAGGTFNVYFELRRSISAWYARARIYKNWVAYGTARETLNTSFTWFTEILSFSPWDFCQLYVWTDDVSNPAFVQNFQLSWYMVQEIMAPSLLLN